MFDSTIRRSVATLGVVAGILTAAVPASAAGVPLEGPNVALTGLKAGQSSVLNETVTVRADALGTQVGSEGVKAPANADEQMKDNVKAVVVLIGANDYGFTEGNGQPTRGGDGQDTEARIGGKMHLEDISLGIRGDAQDTQASLGRENSIECLVRAEVPAERWTQSLNPAPLAITFAMRASKSSSSPPPASPRPARPAHPVRPGAHCR
jgi:hypothetical protein